MGREADRAERAGRKCACGTRLSIWNTSPRCAVCERMYVQTMTGNRPPVMPYGFWASPRFRHAFETRDMGKILRLYRTSQEHRGRFGPDGITQELLAAWLGLSQAQVSSIECGKKHADSLSKMIEWAETLSIPNELLWFDLPGTSRFPGANLTGEDAEEDVDPSNTEQPTAAELLASEIKRFRMAAKLTQRELAQRSGYTREYISMAERRDRNIPSYEVVRALDTTLNAGGYLLELRTRAKAEQAALRNRLQGSPDEQNFLRHQHRSENQTSDEDSGAGARQYAAAIAASVIAYQMTVGKGHGNALIDVQEIVDAMKRRDLLSLLGAATATAFMPRLLDNLDQDEQERVIDAVITPSRADPAVLHHVENVLFDTLRTNDIFGPDVAMPTVIAQLQIVYAIVRDCPAILRPRALSVLSNTTRVAGWVSFNANKFGDARRYYEQARTIAHDAGDIALAAFVLGNLAHLADTAKQPALAIDYAVAATTWANRTDNDNQCLRAFTSDMAAIAHARVGDEKTALTYLDTTANTHLPHCSANSGLSPFYTYNSGLHAARRGEVQFTLGRTQDAHETITNSLAHYQKQVDASDTSPGVRTNIAVSTIRLADLYRHIGDKTQAVTTLERVIPFLGATKSPRIKTQVKTLETQLIEPRS